ncbi:LPXTG cell wall anchor domain-containing protein [Enterococcus caccae]|uniref:LPXTG-domain-containing protein cell wall anchor domain n=1 Tax=Enterococcus caccae ATCC BAA-1240 TaxID=1158612 RepID=R3WBB3_9ENTE|nr:LPXTG cell wall anchor domain-containing protein [Enterococcus caccae]EOL45216.1 LPXTG-domain-containing protein cell wall anchor domain [Enterococcus caccae ATCC BAA-1240]EOT58623.1 hypothetical protein I580_02794 [Enterococcus caccae ATCC BAA-1240]
MNTRMKWVGLIFILLLTISDASSVVQADEGNQGTSKAGIKFGDSLPPKESQAKSENEITTQQENINKEDLPMTNEKKETYLFILGLCLLILFISINIRKIFERKRKSDMVEKN